MPGSEAAVLEKRVESPHAAATSLNIVEPFPRGWTRAKIATLLGILLVSAGIYGWPWVAASSGDRAGLPPTFSADAYAYLNFSHVLTFSDIPDHDPWYGVPIHPQFSHSTFRTAFALFGVVRSLSGSDVVASVAWNIAWSVLIAFSLWWLLRELFPQASAAFLFAATSMMLFFTLSALKIAVVDWLHLLSGSVRQDLPLPFIRMFFPQVAVPLLAFYFWHCKKAWDSGRPRHYISLVLLQMVAFVSFPYASVYMGLVTLLFLLLAADRGSLRKRALPFAVVGLACMVADGVYLRLAIAHVGSTPPVQAAAPTLHLDFGQLRTDFGGTAVLLLAFSALLLLLRRKDSSGLMVVAIGTANVLMLLADCIIDPRFLVSHHAGYFVQISLGLELCALFYWARDFVSPGFSKWAAVAASVLFVCNGAVASWGTFRASAPTNFARAKFAEVIRGLNLNSDDLLVSPAEEVDDFSTAVPLLSRARVLYTPEAEILLGPGTENLINERHAIYLYLTRRDSNWVAAKLSKHLLPSAILTLTQRFALFYRRRPDVVEKEVRNTLLPQLVALNETPQSSILGGSHRVVILDDSRHPIFDDFHVSRLLTVREDYRVGPIRVRTCSMSQ